MLKMNSKMSKGFCVYSMWACVCVAGVLSTCPLTTTAQKRFVWHCSIDKGLATEHTVEYPQFLLKGCLSNSSRQRTTAVLNFTGREKSTENPREAVFVYHYHYYSTEIIFLFRRLNCYMLLNGPQNNLPPAASLIMWKTMEQRNQRTESRAEADLMDAEPEGVARHQGEVEDGMRLESNTHAQRLLKGAGSLWQEGALCDVILEAEGVQFAGHRAILASVSSYCRLLFTGSPSPFPSGGLVKLQGVRAHGLEQVLGFVYRGHMTLSLDVVEETLQAAKILMIRDAIKICLHFLDVSLTPETCTQILAVAHRLGPSQFHRRVLGYLGAHCKSLLKDPETLLDLDPKALLELVSQDDLGDISETNVLRGALRWLQHNPDHAVHAHAVFCKLRLPLVPPEALLDELGERPLVCTDPHCLQLLRQALAYHARPYLQPALQGPSTTVRGATPCLVVLGGRTVGNQVSREVWATAEGDMDWSRLGELGAPLYNHCCVVLNNFLFILGGQHQFDPCGKQPTNEVHRYDPRSESWLQVPGMLEKRTRFHADVLSEGLVAVAGGTSLGKLTASTERYSLSEDRWEPTAPLPVAVVDHAGATHKGILYISGGFSGGNTLPHLYSYLPRLKRWVVNRPLAFSRCDHGMATLEDAIYCVGGRTLSKEKEWVHVNEMESYRPAVDQWTMVRVSPLRYSQFSLTASGQRLYVTGGGSLHNRSKTTGVFTYTKDRKWECAGMLPVVLADHCACILSISAQTLRRIKSQGPPLFPTPRRGAESSVVL